MKLKKSKSIEYYDKQSDENEFGTLWEGNLRQLKSAYQIRGGENVYISIFTYTSRIFFFLKDWSK